MNKQEKVTLGCKELYQHMVQELLAKNPEYWSRGGIGVAHSRVYTKGTGGRVIEVMSYKRFMKVVRQYFVFARKRVIEGYRVNLGSDLGGIQARTISRNYKKKVTDWAATMKNPKVFNEATGKFSRKKVYYTSDTYSRIKWEKWKGVANRKFYSFRPCKGGAVGKGFTGEFSAALKRDPLLEKKYKQHVNGLQINQFTGNSGFDPAPYQATG